MNIPIDWQTIRDADGRIQYVVVPYGEYLRLAQQEPPSVPNEVVERVVMGKQTPIRAWREHLGFTQREVAGRMGVTQAAFAQWEAAGARPRKATLKRIAQALGLDMAQLDF